MRPGCTAECMLEACGNAVMDANEVCDDGANGDNDDGCTDLCTAAECGDGFIWENNEQCDNGPENADDAACKSHCTDNFCGDGSPGPGEECDDGNKEETDTCTTVCKNAKCGDGFSRLSRGWPHDRAAAWRCPCGWPSPGVTTRHGLNRAGVVAPLLSSERAHALEHAP